MGVRKGARWLLRYTVFAGVAVAGFVVVFIIGAAYPDQTADIYLWGGIVAWGLANRVDEVLFEEDKVTLTYVNDMLSRNHEERLRVIGEDAAETAERVKAYERIAYLRGVLDAVRHPERVMDLLAEAETEAASHGGGSNGSGVQA